LWDTGKIDLIPALGDELADAAGYWKPAQKATRIEYRLSQLT
jgi:hypothetical protein